MKYKQSQSNNKDKTRKVSKRRILHVKVFILVVFFVILARLGQIQVFHAAELQVIAKDQYEEIVPLPASRGNIFDRNGIPLVSNTIEVSVYIDPSVIVKDSVSSLVRIFSEQFGGSRKQYLELFKSKKQYVLVKKRAVIDVKKFFEDKHYYGVILVDEPKRLYHYGPIGSQLLGGITADTIGAGGIERSLSNELKGKNGYMILQRNGKGMSKATVEYPRVEPTNGNDVYLTIDLAYQFIAEEELQIGVKKFEADLGMIVMLKPATGEILAIAQYPNFNPNNILLSDSNHLRIRAVTDMIEPGSVFKIVTASAAIENKLVKLEQSFFAENGSYKIYHGKTFRSITDHVAHSYLTFREAMEQSSNIVFAKISDIIGDKVMYTQARNFGFGSLTNIELPVEAAGMLNKPSDWSAYTLNTMAYGYEISATPLQMASAYAAIANKGVLMKPFLVKKIINEKIEVVKENQPTTIRRVISENTAYTLKKILEGVIRNGTAKAAGVEGLSIAGKTGTARQIIDKKYSHKRYFASFIGFFPVEDPQVVCLVILDNPKHGGYTGGTTSAPIFHEIAYKLCNVKGVHVNNTDHSKKTNLHSAIEVVSPEVRNMQYSDAKKVLENQGLISQRVGDGKIIDTQNPKAGTIVNKGSTIILTTNIYQSAEKNGFRTVPDVVGFPLRRAINRLEIEGLESRAYGSGIVTSQSPEAGVVASEKTIVSLVCNNPKPTASR
jgi:cell division protein FtsI (penicillin-binding protein 3)